MRLPLQYNKLDSGCFTNKRRRVRAFTLLEIIIALSIFLLMVIGIYSSWSQIHRSTRVGLERAAENQRKRVAIRALEQSLGSVKYFLANETNYTFFAELDGRSSYLSFVSHLPNNFPRSSIFPYQPMRRVRFSVEDGTNGLGRLVLRQQPFLYEANIDEDENPLILANDLDSFYVEFLPDGEDAEWQDYWDMTNDIPVMARVSLEYKYENRSDPEIVTKLIQLASSPVPAEFQLGRTGSNRSRSSGDSRDRAGRGDSRSRGDMSRGGSNRGGSNRGGSNRGGSNRGGSNRGPVSSVPSRGGGGKSGGR